MVEPFYMPNAFPADFTLPARYFVKEPTTGILKVAPFIWLAIVPVVLAAWRRRPVGAPAGRSVLWLVVGLLGAAGLAAVGPMQLVSSTNRYLADFVPCLVMLAVIGMWQLHVFVVGKKWLNRLFKTLVGAAGAYTCLAGLLLAVSGEQDHFSMHNPKWMKTMKQYTGCLQAPAVHTDPRPPLYPVAGDLWVTPGRDGFYWSDGMRWMALQQPMEFRITFVEPSKSEIEPIIVAGRPGASDVIYVRYMPGHRVTFGHNHTGRPANEGVTFTIMPNRPYRVDMDLDQANGVLTIALEGQMVYGARADFFPFARRDLLLGKNPGRFEPAGSEFAGTITPAN
jgi:hypothetical protein